MRFLILAVLIGLPIVEISLFIKMGGLIGILPTLLLIFVISALGAALLRRQGLQSFTKVQRAMAQGEAPVDDMLDGFFLVVAGLLFILPGFFSDILGLCLLLPPIRKLLRGYVRRRFNVQTMEGRFYAGGDAPYARRDGGPVIEGEAEEIRDEIDPDYRLPPKN